MGGDYPNVLLRNRIRFEFLTTRLGDCEQTLFLIDNNFIYRALSALQKVCVHILLHDTLYER